MTTEFYYVYIIQELIDGSWYIGFSTDPFRRLGEHNHKIGGEHTRKKNGQWKLIYFEAYCDKSDALGREKYLKSGSGRRFIKRQLNHYLNSDATLAQW